MKRTLGVGSFHKIEGHRPLFPGALDLYDHGLFGIRLAVAGNAFRQEETLAIICFRVQSLLRCTFAIHATQEVHHQPIHLGRRFLRSVVDASDLG
jgi:hypothetical protein